MLSILTQMSLVVKGTERFQRLSDKTGYTSDLIEANGWLPAGIRQGAIVDYRR
jgi:hypothetical protein